MGGVPAAGPGAPARSCTAGQGPLSRLKKICLSPPLYSHCRSVYPQPFPSHPPQKFKERWKNQAEVPALATFASDARRDLGILPAAYLASPKAHQEQNERIGKKPHHFGLSTQSGSISSGAGAKAAVVIPANSPGKEPRPALRRRPGSCKTQLMLETHTHTRVLTHTALSLFFIYTTIYGQCSGKGLSHSGLLTARKESRDISPPGGSLCSLFPLPRSRDPHRGEWCQGRTPPAPLFPRDAPAGGEGWGGHSETARCTVSFPKAGFSEVIKPRAMANFPLSQPILFHCVPFLRGQVTQSRGRCGPGTGTRAEAAAEVGHKGQAHAIFMRSP